MNRALFLDRDGVINEDYGYVHKIEDFHFRDGIFDVCKAAMRNNYLLVVVTNQAGIGRNMYTVAEYYEITNHMISRFAQESIALSGIFYCPYHPEHGIGHFKKDSPDRKPQPGMLIKAARSLDINLSQSIMVGDKITDSQAACNSGIRYYVDASAKDWQHRCISLLNY